MNMFQRLMPAGQLPADETIVNSDLVAWVMCAVQHLPRREDVPIISNLPTGFTIKPINYFQQVTDSAAHFNMLSPVCSSTAGQRNLPVCCRTPTSMPHCSDQTCP